MARGNIPVIQLRRLRGELRRARESAGRTQKQVADDLGWSLSKVIRQETGAQNISTADVMALMHYYGITDTDLIESLLAITRAKEQACWWDDYKDIYPKWFLEFLAYENSATSIRQFQMLDVPGLLQTESYARALLDADEELQDIEQGVRVRLRRQEILNRENGGEMQFILDEAVIHRVVGDRETMFEQLQQLRKMNKRPHVSIQIVPFTAGVKAAMIGSFAIFEFAGSIANNNGGLDVEYVVNTEKIGPNRDAVIHDNPETTSGYLESFYGIRDIALSKDDTNVLLDAKIESFRAL